MSSERVLVIEDDPETSRAVADWLAEDGFAVETCATSDDGLERALADPPVLVLLDVFVSGRLDGWETLARLKAAPATARVPVILCASGSHQDRAAALGSADVIAKPFSAEQLRDAVRRILPGAGGRVLVVDDDTGVRSLVASTLRAEGIEIAEAADGEEALAAMEEHRPGVVVLDLIMPRLDGFGVLERMHADPSLRSVPVIVLTARLLSPEDRRLLYERATSVLEKTAYSASELRRLVLQALGRAVRHPRGRAAQPEEA